MQPKAQANTHVNYYNANASAPTHVMENLSFPYVCICARVFSSHIRIGATQKQTQTQNEKCSFHASTAKVELNQDGVFPGTSDEKLA